MSSTYSEYGLVKPCFPKPVGQASRNTKCIGMVVCCYTTKLVPVDGWGGCSNVL